jgi:hypothetical protein
MSEAFKITLAGTDYTVPPLNLGQLRTLGVGIARSQDMNDAALTREAKEEAGYKTMTDAITAALSQGNPEIDAAALDKMTISWSELNEAYKKVYANSGLTTKAGAPGEDPAVGQE